jgi:hypothetical protein
MEEFTLRGGGDYVKITLTEIFGFPETTCFNGGYDTKSAIEIYSDGFKVHSTIWISTGEIFEFYDQLLIANKNLKGIAYLRNMEGNLEMNVRYGNDGHVEIAGIFTKQNSLNNTLNFNIESDQSYIQSTLKQLEPITNKYGGMKGIKS